MFPLVSAGATRSLYHSIPLGYRSYLFYFIFYIAQGLSWALSICGKLITGKPFSGSNTHTRTYAFVSTQAHSSLTHCATTSRVITPPSPIVLNVLIIIPNTVIPVPSFLSEHYIIWYKLIYPDFLSWLIIIFINLLIHYYILAY